MIDATDVGAQVAGYGPLMIATAGLATALISGFSRRDKRSVDQSSTLDARTNTALKGLDTALSRVEAERARWQAQAEADAARADAAEAEADELRAQLATAQAQLDRRRTR